MGIVIRAIKKNEVQRLIELSVQTFSETFADTNTAEDMEAYFARAYDEEKLRDELSRRDTWFYFAEVNGELAGYLMVNINDAQTELQEDDAYEIERIYILEKYYGSGLGARMMEFALQKGRELGKAYVWLGVWEYNFRAQAFYKKYDFEEFSYHTFMMGDTPQRDLLLRRGL